MRRGISAVAMAAAIVLGATACGGGSSTTDNGAAKDPSSVSGTITYWDTSDATNEAPAYQALIATFVKSAATRQARPGAWWPSTPL